jgi:hypothetical protein
VATLAEEVLATASVWRAVSTAVDHHQGEQPHIPVCGPPCTTNDGAIDANNSNNIAVTKVTVT